MVLLFSQLKVEKKRLETGRLDDITPRQHFLPQAIKNAGVMAATRAHFLDVTETGSPNESENADILTQRSSQQTPFEYKRTIPRCLSGLKWRLGLWDFLAFWRQTGRY